MYVFGEQLCFGGYSFNVGISYVSFRYESRPAITCLDKDGADGMVAPRLARRWMRVLTAHMRHSGTFLRRPNAKAPGLCQVGAFMPATANHCIIRIALSSELLHA